MRGLVGVRLAGVAAAGELGAATAEAKAEAAVSEAVTLATGLGPTTVPDLTAPKSGQPLHLVLAGEAQGGLSAEAAKAMATLLPSAAAEMITPGKQAYQRLATAVLKSPHVLATMKAVVAEIHGPRMPTTICALIDVAREAAEAQVLALPNAPQEPTPREHLILGTAILALAAQALKADPAHKNGLRVREQFPLYLFDGRSNDCAYDKTNHVLSHAMFSFLSLYDQRYGDGKVSELLMKSMEVDRDPKIVAQIEEAYLASEGRVGPLLKSYRAPPIDESPLFYQGPEGLSPAEQAAYDGAVCVGHMHEHHTTDPYALADIGLASGAAAAPDGHDIVRGLADPGVGRDLLANRLGAIWGVMAMRDPPVRSALPWDDGRGGPSAPYHELSPELPKLDLAAASEPGLCAARAAALLSGLHNKAFKPEKLVAAALKASGLEASRPAQIHALGKRLATTLKASEGEVVVVEQHQHGKLILRLSTTPSAEGYASFTLDLVASEILRLRRALPAGLLPPKKDLVQSASPPLATHS